MVGPAEGWMHCSVPETCLAPVDTRVHLLRPPVDMGQGGAKAKQTGREKQQAYGATYVGTLCVYQNKQPDGPFPGSACSDAQEPTMRLKPVAQ